MLVLLLLAGCFTESLPCDDYCGYICDCHAGEAEYNCDECFASYEDAATEVQDACGTALNDLRRDDNANGTGCSSGGDDTGR